MSASKFIHYFSSHPETYGFWASLPPDSITLNPTNKRTDHRISDFQTGIGAGGHATLDTKQFISYTKAALVDKTTSLQSSDG